MSRQRFVGLAMVVAWLAAPGLQAWAAHGDHSDAACQGHACQCRRHCPPKRTAAPDCHASAASSVPAKMTGRCTHDEPSAPAASRGDGLPGQPVGLGLRLVSLPAPDPSPADPLAGHSRIDPRPPRAAS